MNSAGFLHGKHSQDFFLETFQEVRHRIKYY
jgi:hypothetical protein